MRCNAEFYYVGKIPPIGIGLQRRVFYNGFIHREPSEQLCRRYMRSTECPSSCFYIINFFMLCRHGWFGYSSVEQFNNITKSAYRHAPEIKYLRPHSVTDESAVTTRLML